MLRLSRSDHPQSSGLSAASPNRLAFCFLVSGLLWHLGLKAANRRSRGQAALRNRAAPRTIRVSTAVAGVAAAGEGGGTGPHNTHSKRRLWRARFGLHLSDGVTV